MEENCRVRIPVKFNCWKHHVRFIKKQISGLHTEEDIKQLKKFLLLIGRSQIDLYAGDYSPLNISVIVIEELKNRNLLNYNSYKLWLNKNGENYCLITLPDQSTWTLRPGGEIKRYVHIHPGRYSLHTKRIKATTLKTAICILAWQKIFPKIIIDLKIVNKLRKEFVLAPPLRSLKHNTGLDRLLNLFNSI